MNLFTSQLNDNMIPEYRDIKNTLNLAILVYDYKKKFYLNKKPTSTLIKRYINISDIQMNDQSKDALQEIIQYSPDCQIYKFYQTINGVDVGISITHINKRITLVFRCSNEYKDWLYNLMALRKHIENNIYVHYGFYNQLMADELFSNLANDLNILFQKYNDYQFYITGHSLGGALAILFGYLFIKNKNIEKNQNIYAHSYNTQDISTPISEPSKKNWDITIVTFGNPRVGNYYFMKQFNSIYNIKHYRIVNKYDIVTSVPYLYYYHVGIKILIDKKNNHINFHTTDYIDNISLFKYYSIKNHKIYNYYKYITSLAW